MPEIGTSGSMSGDGKRGVGHRPQAAAPILDSTRPISIMVGRFCCDAKQLLFGCGTVSAFGFEESQLMMFMVVETFRNQDAKSIYRRLREKGRMMPDGLKFVSSWVAADLGRCFQLMEADDITLLQRWICGWSDLMAFEIVPVVSGKDAAEALSGDL
jgi:Protein of unknown function (DUF3303)